MRKILEKVRTTRGKGSSEKNKKKFAAIERDITMNKANQIDYDKILRSVSLSIDLPALGVMINKIPEERRRFLDSFIKTFGIIPEGTGPDS